MILNRVLLATTAFAALMSCANAADLPNRPAYAPAPMMSPTPVYNWTGIYVGLNGGYGWGSQDPLNLITNRFDGNSLGFSGGVFGGTAGAQIQSGHVVLGFEADLDWAGMKGSGTFVPSIGGAPFLPPLMRTPILIGKQLRGRASDTLRTIGCSTRLEGSQYWVPKPPSPQRWGLPAVLTELSTAPARASRLALRSGQALNMGLLRM